MGKPFVRSQLELARSHKKLKDSLDIFGQSTISQHSYSSPDAPKTPIFSKAPGSAWDDALRAAEVLLQGPERRLKTTAEARSRKVPDVKRKSETTEICLDELIGELEAAEEDSKSSPATWEGLLDKVRMEHSGGQPHLHSNGYESRSRSSRSSDSETISGAAGVSDDFISERAAQWGYGVVLKKSSRESTPRTSSGSATGGNGGTQAIPAVSRDVKDALASFQLAFLVCDATLPDHPILYASAGFTTMTGYSADEIVGKNCRFLQGADTDRSEIANIREALKNSGTYTGTVLNYKKDGTPFWNLLTLSPIKDDDGKVIKYIGMQAEQTSKERQPRNSRGEKSPAVRPLQGPTSTTIVQDVGEKSKLAVGAAAPAHRRHSSSSLPKPPIVPTKSAPAERRSAGAELHHGEPLRRMSQRYSLTSNPARSTRNSKVEEYRNSKVEEYRNSKVEEYREPDWREESAPRLRTSVENGKSTSFFKSPETTAAVETGAQKNKTGRLTSRILRLFRKNSKESKRELETVVSGKEFLEFSDSEDERDAFDSAGTSTGNSASNSRTDRRSSGGYSVNRRSGSLLRSEEASVDDLCNSLKGLNDNRGGHQQSSTVPPFDGAKQQFCIVHT